MMNLKFKIIYSSKAKSDFKSIHNYLLHIGVSHKNILKIKNNIVIKINNLLLFPKLGNISKISEFKKYRVLIVENFLVFYEITNEYIFIHRIINGKQNYKDILFKSKKVAKSYP